MSETFLNPTRLFIKTLHVAARICLCCLCLWTGSRKHAEAFQILFVSVTAYDISFKLV